MTDCAALRLGFAVALAMCILTPPARAESVAAAACIVARPPDSLWSLVQCCTRDLRSNSSCRYYSKTDDFIILKDNSPAKPRAYLIIPTTKVTGIEDPHIFAPPVADFWAYGWEQAGIYLKKPAVETGLAINSEFGRTQNQLHIHISCLRPDVARVLAENAPKIGDDPVRPFALALGPHRNIYRTVETRSLTARSPFEVAAAMPGAADDMKDQSIAVAGAAEPGAYFVLDTTQRGDNPGTA